MAIRAQLPGPLDLPDFDEADHAALKALLRGAADEAQQRRAVDAIVKQLCGIGRTSFHPESARASDFAEGKRWVGVTLIDLANMPAEELRAVRERRAAPKTLRRP